ncbi:unnamed protein product [Macrosiphum euphorbiae]|uniref:Uncharacterized protein n=1 Tax=Macrosiphum euphorbiae TaxID=13131 RepID=A0AAV0XW80_9HEMI|nr:unnamed protein product [Macrosiphum euphorbiae]
MRLYCGGSLGMDFGLSNGFVRVLKRTPIFPYVNRCGRKSVHDGTQPRCGFSIIERFDHLVESQFFHTSIDTD